MSLITPSDDVQVRMQALRIQNEERLVKQAEQVCLAELRKLEKEKEEAEKDRLALIEAEAEMRIQIEGFDDAKKEEIKNKLKMNIHVTTICADAFDPTKAMLKNTPENIAKGISHCRRHVPYYIELTNSSIHYETEAEKKKRKGLVRKKQDEIYLQYILKVNDEYLAEKKAEDDKNHQKALEILKADIAKANKALPKYKLNGGVFEELSQLSTIEFISNERGFSFETLHLYPHRHFPPHTQRHPGSIIIPTSWKDDYAEGKLPFLIQCPVCSKQNKIVFKCTGQTQYEMYYSKYISEVTCNERQHYMWNPQTNKHHKWALFPDKRFANINECHNSHGIYREWDPKDPDGEKAKSLHRDAKIKSIESQILELHAEITRLKDGGDI